MSLTRNAAIAIARHWLDVKVEWMRATFKWGCPKALNLFDEAEVERYATSFETTLLAHGTVQVHTLVRAVHCTGGTVTTFHGGEGTIEDGGVYFKPGDTIHVTVDAGRHVRVTLFGIVIPSELQVLS
jgi:hypothetical protein